MDVKPEAASRYSELPSVQGEYGSYTVTYQLMSERYVITQQSSRNANKQGVVYLNPGTHEKSVLKPTSKPLSGKKNYKKQRDEVPKLHKGYLEEGRKHGAIYRAKQLLEQQLFSEIESFVVKTPSLPRQFTCHSHVALLGSTISLCTCNATHVNPGALVMQCMAFGLVLR